MATNHSTNEWATEQILKTHWYRDSYNIVRDAIIQVANQLAMAVISVNDEYKEIYIASPKHRVTVKITTYRVCETSVDFYVESMSMLDFTGWKKLIATLYDMLGKRLIFIGTSLHP